MFHAGNSITNLSFVQMYLSDNMVLIWLISQSGWR